MGLLDQVLGNALGGQSRGNNNALMMALMALLASRAGGQGGVGGGLGGLGGMLGGAGMGSGMPGGMSGMGGLGGGLGGLLERFQQAGHGDAMNSWIGPGQNRQITPDHLGEALGPDTVDALSRQTGLGRGDLLSQLSRTLPGVVDQLTPNGRLPHDSEYSQW